MELLGYVPVRSSFYIIHQNATVTVAWDKTSNSQHTLSTTYTTTCALLTLIVVRSTHWELYFLYAVPWQLFHIFGHGSLLKVQFRSKFALLYFVKNYYYLLNREREAVTVEAFDNWKKVLTVALL